VLSAHHSPALPVRLEPSSQLVAHGDFSPNRVGDFSTSVVAWVRPLMRFPPSAINQTAPDGSRS